MVYNPKNQLIKKQKIINYKQNTIENNTTAYIFNDSGLLIEEQFFEKDGTIRNKLLHQYNKQGDIIKSTYKNGDYIVYDYKYDAQNNWIWKRKPSTKKVDLAQKWKLQNVSLGIEQLNIIKKNENLILFLISILFFTSCNSKEENSTIKTNRKYRKTNRKTDRKTNCRRAENHRAKRKILLRLVF